jgi:alpha-galactosidase
VINEVQVGGYAATRADFDIPARYGVRQTIGDTLGIGGIFRGLRTIPVTVALARDMAEVCPDAYLLSYSNPMAMLPWAVYEGSAFTRVFGLCHSVRDTQAFLTQLTGADPERVRFLTAGFNHQAFVLRFEQDGESLYPRLAEVIDASPELQRRVRVEIYRRFGYFPTESSEHSAEYVPWFMRHDDQIDQFRIFVGERAGLAVHPRARDRHRARAAREHPQRRADRQPAGRVLRRGTLRGRCRRRSRA